MTGTKATTTGKYRDAGRACACFNLRRATRMVTQLYDKALKPAGIRATQFTVLVAIGSGGPISVNQLADRIVMDRTTLTRNLKPLEREGLIAVRPGDDLRVREVSLTAKGRKTLERSYPLWERVQARLREQLGDSRVDKLLVDLQATVKGLRGSTSRLLTG